MDVRVKHTLSSPGARSASPGSITTGSSLAKTRGDQLAPQLLPVVMGPGPPVRNCALGVEPQEVVLGQTEPADGRLRIYTTVGPVPVVLVQPERQLLGAPI